MSIRAACPGARSGMRRGRACRYLGGDFRARTETGINQFLCSQPFKRIGIESKPLRLAHDGAVPGQAEPSQIFNDSSNMLFPRTARIDVLYAEQKRTPARSCEVVREQGGNSVAEMQPSRRARGKSADDRAFRCNGLLTASRVWCCHIGVTLGSDKRDRTRGRRPGALSHVLSATGRRSAFREGFSSKREVCAGSCTILISSGIPMAARRWC